MRRKSFDGMNCPIAGALEIVGEWWTLLVVREAFLGVRRFDELQRRLGIARNVLTARLRALVRDGVLERSRYSERPARFEYRLTEKGLALYPVIVTLMAWGNRWAAGRRGPPVVLVDRGTGGPVEPVLVDRGTGRPIVAGSARAVPGPGANRETRLRLGVRNGPRTTPPRRRRPSAPPGPRAAGG